MVHIGIFIGIIGGVLGLSPWTVSSYALPKYWLLSIANVVIWAGILLRYRTGRQQFHYSPMSIPVIIFIFVSLLSTLSSLDWTVSIFGNYRSFSHSVFTYASLGMLAFGVAYSRKYVSDRFVLGSVLCSMVVACAYSFFQYAGYEFMALMSDHFKGHVSSSAGNPVYFSSLITLLFPLSIWAAFDKKGSRRFIGIVALVFMVAAAYFIQKRGVWVGIASGSLLYIWLSGRVKIDRFRACAILAILFLCAISYAPRLYTNKSDVGRMEAWKVGVKTFYDNPMVGTGPDTFRISYRKHKSFNSIESVGSTLYVHFDAHNDVIQIASTLGYYGLMGYAMILLGMFFVVGNSMRENVFKSAGIASGIGALFIIAKINPVPIGTEMLCAILLGVLLRSEHFAKCEAHIFPNQVVAIGNCALSLVVFAGVSCMISADYLRMSAHKMRFKDPLVSAQLINKAAGLAPWMIDIRIDQAKSLYFLPMRMTKETGIQISEIAVKIGRDALRLHPNDSQAHSLLAMALLIRQMWGGEAAPEEATRFFNSAQKLAPMFAPLMHQRAALARSIGDRKSFLKASKEVRVVSSFTERKLFN